MSEIKQETLQVIKGIGKTLADVKAMFIEYSHYSRDAEVLIELKESDSIEVKEAKLNSMKWEYHECPSIPNHLK